METQTTISTADFEKLSEVCLTSASYLYSAAQQVRNRGMKLILKTYAQQRLRFAAEIERLLAIPNQQATLEQASDPINRGWMNLQAGLTIKRGERQRLVIKEVLHHEDEMIGHYQATLQQSLPSAVANTLQKQFKILQVERNRLALMAAEKFEHKLFVRLFDQEGKAEQVVDQLAQAGITDNDIDLVPIERFSLFRPEQEESDRSRRDTVGTGILFGAGIGALIALLPGIGHSLFLPEIGGLFSNSPIEIVFEWLLAGAIVGALFAFVFSMFLGQDTAEDDSYVYDESLENGNTLLAVFATPNNRSHVERIIGLKHQFEVKPMGA